MPKRLLLVSDAAVIGGVTRIVVNLAHGLAARRWQVRTIFPAWADQEFVSWCTAQGLEPELSPWLTAWSEQGIVGGLRSQLQLQSFFRAAKPDVVNFHYSGSIISLKDIVAARLARVPRCVASVHLVARWRRERTLRRTMTAIAGAVSDSVIAESSAAAEGQVDAGVPRSRVVVIANGARVPSVSIDKNDARVRLGIGADEFVAGAALRLAPVKRVHDLIEAIGLARAKGAPVLGIIAGDGPERATLEQLAQSRASGGIQFLGQRLDPTDVYVASDVVVLPSELEGQPNMPIEAALCGRPCIGTAIGGTSDIIVNDRTGFLVPVGAPHEIADRLMLLYSDRELARRMGKAASQRAHEEFTAERMVGRYDEVLSRGYSESHSR